MFKGDHPDLNRTIDRALRLALDRGHPRTGSEHLLAALADGPPDPHHTTPTTTTATSADATTSAISNVLHRHGATTSAILNAAHLAAPLGAGGAVDRAVLAPLGVDLDRLLGPATTTLDHPAGREPLLPLNAAKARRHCARLTPPLGLDAQAAYEAGLRLALARREREHRPEHLALALVALDPGVVRRYQRTTGRAVTSADALPALIRG